MQHAGVQYGPGAAPTLHSTHYTPPDNTAPVPNGNTTTSVLRSWRKKDATIEKLPPAEPPPLENQGPVARVAPHAHYPKQPVSDAYRFGQAFGDYSLPQAPQAPVPVKYSEIIEPMQGGIEHISPLVMAKPKEKYLDVCHIQQPHAVNAASYKPYSETMKNYANMQQYKEQFHPYMQKESQIPSNYVQKESTFPTYLPNYKMQNQYPRSYRENNDFLTSLNKIAPQMAQDIINDPHLRDSSQFPVYHSLDQNRLYQQQQRMYQPIHPTPSYGQRTLPPQNYNQYGMNQQRISTDAYRLHQYQNNLARYSHEQMAPPPNTISPRHQYSEMNFSPLSHHRISPTYPPCSQLEYSQHYQHRQVPPIRQEYIPVSDKTTYLDNPPEIPEIIPEESVQQPTKSLKRFLETWSEDHIVEETETQAPQQDKVQIIKTPTPHRTGENTLYVLDAMEISSENIPQYLHLQPIDKLPPNIRGFYDSPETKTNDANKNCAVKTNESETATKNEETNGEEVIESVIKSLPDLSYHNDDNPAPAIEPEKPSEENRKNEESCEKNIQCDLFKAKNEDEQEKTEKAETKNANSEGEEEEEENDEEDQSSVYSDYSEDEVSDRNERSRSPIAPIIISCGESVIIKRKVKSETKKDEESEERALNLSKRHPSENDADNNNEKQFVDKHDETENEESFKVEKRGVIMERRQYDIEQVNNCDACSGQKCENKKRTDEIQEDGINEEKQTGPESPDQNSEDKPLEEQANEEEHQNNEENRNLSSPIKEDETTDDIGDTREEKSVEERTTSSKADEESDSNEEIETTNESETISEIEEEDHSLKSPPTIADFVEESQVIRENTSPCEASKDVPCSEIQGTSEEISQSEVNLSEECFVLEVAKELLQFTISEENGQKTISIIPLTAVKIVINEKQVALDDDQEVSSSNREAPVEIRKEDDTMDIPMKDELDHVEEMEVIKETKEEISAEHEEMKAVIIEEAKEEEAKEDIRIAEEVVKDSEDITEENETNFIEESEGMFEEIIEAEEVIGEEDFLKDDVAIEEELPGEVLETPVDEGVRLEDEETESESEEEMTSSEENSRHASVIHQPKENLISVVSNEEEKEAAEKTRQDVSRETHKIEDEEKSKHCVEETACMRAIPFEYEVCEYLKIDEDLLVVESTDVQQDLIDEYTITSQVFEGTKITVTNRRPYLANVKATMTETTDNFEKCVIFTPKVQIGEEIVKTAVIPEDDEMPKLVPYEVDGNTSVIEYEMPDSLGNPEVILDHHVSETIEVSSLEVSSTTNETSERSSKSPEAKFKRIKSPNMISSRHYRKKAKAQKEALKKQVNHVQLKCTLKLEEIKILKQTPKSALNLGRKDARKKKKVSFKLDEDDKQMMGEGETTKRTASPVLISTKKDVAKVEGRSVTAEEKSEDNSKAECPIKTKENLSYSSSNVARSLWKSATKNEKLFTVGGSPAKETNTSNKRRLSLEEYIKRKKYIRDLAQKTPRSNSETNSVSTEIPKKSFHLDKSAIEEKLNSLELYLPKVNKIPQQKTTAQEEVSRKLEELLAQKPINFESRASESALIRRFLNRECLKPEEVKKIRQIVQYKRALEQMKSRKPDCRRRYSYDFSKNVNIDFRDFEMKGTANRDQPKRLNIKETNKELHESILSLSEANEVSSSQPSPEVSKVTVEAVQNEEAGKDSTKPTRISGNEAESNLQPNGDESQPKTVDSSSKPKKPINPEATQPKSPVPMIKEIVKLDLPPKPKPKPDESKHTGDITKPPPPKELFKPISEKSQVSNAPKPASSETQKSNKPEENSQPKPKEIVPKSDLKSDLQVDKTVPPSGTRRNCLISPQDLKTRLNVLLNLYKKQVQTSNENNTTIDMENLRKIEEIVQKLASSNKNVYEIRRPETLVSHSKNTIKIHLKKVPGDGQQKRRKRFRNLYSGEDSEDELPTAKEAKMSLDTSLTNASAIDYSVYQRNTQAGVPKLVIKRRKSELKVDLQPFVKLIRMPTLDSLAKKRRKTIKLLVR